MAAPFLSLAYAELKVNFVEGFAVLAALFLVYCLAVYQSSGLLANLTGLLLDR